MGWNFVKQISRIHEVIAITRVNNRGNIERYQAENPEKSYENIKFFYFDLPYWMRFWKNGSRGALLYFYLWQQFMPLFILNKKLKFDVSHNLNFHNDWTPSFLWVFKKPFVWGPVGHHPKIPTQFLAEYGKYEVLKDRIVWGVKQCFYRFNPFLHLTKSRAKRILVMNTSVFKRLKSIKDKSVIIPSVASENVVSSHKNFNELHIMSVGRFVPLKGFDVAIRAFGEFMKNLTEDETSRVKYTIIGSGPYECLLKRIAVEVNVMDKISFMDWMDRDNLFKIYNKANVFLFPSHEGAGMVVSEAMSFGLPVLCFNNCGPGEFMTDKTGFKIEYGTLNSCIREFADKMSLLFCEKDIHKEMSRQAVIHHENRFSWESRLKQLDKVYSTLSDET